MLHAMGKRLHIDFPPADFVDNAPAKSVLFGITSGREVNAVTIDGAPRAHLVFDQPGIEFEIEKTDRGGAAPARRRLSIRSPISRSSMPRSLTGTSISILATPNSFSSRRRAQWRSDQG
jgi:hypothetical protein